MAPSLGKRKKRKTLSAPLRAVPLASPLTAEKWGRPVPVPDRLGSWPPDPRRCGKAASESVTNKGRKRKEVCLPLNEAKNGKRVWCRSGTGRPFPNGEDRTFPPAPNSKQLSKQPPPPPHRPRFHPRPGGREGLRPASILGLQLLQKTPGAQDGRGAVREGGALPAVSSDLRRIARRIGNAQTERTTVGRNSLQRIPLGAQGYK